MSAPCSVRKAMADGDVDFLRDGMRVLAHAVMEPEVIELTGAPKGERDPERRLTSLNGSRRCLVNFGFRAPSPRRRSGRTCHDPVQLVG